MALSPSLKCRLANLKQALKLRPTRYSYDPELDLYVGESDGVRRFFNEANRGFRTYRKGIEKAGMQLFNSYCLEHVEFRAEDIVIDCGANYGNLFLNLDGQIREENYISFEPGPGEHRSLKQSIPSGRHFNKGLSNKTGTQIFFLASATADSSLIEPKTFSEKLSIETITLDDFMLDEGISRVRLLKLEAEGFEPEIIQGAPTFLQSCDYIAFDGGPERGLSEEETFTTLTNMLITSGFDLIAINMRGYRGLFENRNIPD